MFALGEAKTLSMWKTRGRLLLVCTIVAVAGCYDREQSGETIVFSFQSWVFLAAVAGSIGVVGIGVLIVRKQRFRGVVLALFGLLLLVLVSPGFLIDQVALDKDHLSLHTGFWFAPTRHDVNFSDVKMAQIEVETKSSRSGPRYSYYINFHMNSGQKYRVPVGDLMKQAYPEIMERLQERGIQVVLPPGMNVE